MRPPNIEQLETDDEKGYELISLWRDPSVTWVVLGEESGKVFYLPKDLNKYEINCPTCSTNNSRGRDSTVQLCEVQIKVETPVAQHTDLLWYGLCEKCSAVYWTATKDADSFEFLVSDKDRLID